MKLITGIDLSANNHCPAIIGERGKKLFAGKQPFYLNSKIIAGLEVGAFLVGALFM